MRRIDHIVLHTTATTPTQDVGVKEITAWHKAAGWKTIGYHFVIRRNGALENGRPVAQVGAHVAGHNTNSIGICLVGGLQRNTKGRLVAANNYTPDQMVTLRRLVTQLTMQFPNATVLGHRDFSPDKDGDGIIEPHEWIKECPCFDARAWARANGFKAAKTPIK